jgi:hypothetical protein
VGDINLNYLEGTSKVKQLNALFKTFNLISTVTFPTRICARTSTATDNIFIDSSKYQEWSDKWKIKINQKKSSQITFTTKCTSCSPVTINNIQIPVQREVKYLGLYLD